MATKVTEAVARAQEPSGVAARAGGAKLPVLVYSAAIFVSAALVFSVQPMMGKLILPRFGGVPAVWTTTMLFFQVVLLAGYVYAHVSIRVLGLRKQAVLHLGLLAVAAIWLPLSIPDIQASASSPVPQLLRLLVVSVGMPFLVVSATGPMLQRWFSSIGHPASPDPYFLYATSNMGSMLGLLAYPLLVEPNATLGAQRAIWSVGFAVLAIALVGCAMWLRRARDLPARETLSRPVAIATRRRLTWAGLAFLPSSLMLGVTTHFTTDIAPVPLLWVVPLALYLLTFIGAFSRRPWMSAMTAGRVLPAVALPLVLLIAIDLTRPLSLMLAVHLSTFAVAAFLCHARLAEDRPPPANLTEFFVWISIGGALGGVFSAVIAPVAFDTVIEYPLVLVLVMLARPGTSGRRGALWGVGLGAIVVTASAIAGWRDMSELTRLVVFGSACAVAVMWARDWLRFASAIATIVVVGLVSGPGVGSIIVRERSFFGVQSVVMGDGGVHVIVHGGTIHGAQDPAEPAQPLTYYHDLGPAGDVFGVRTDARAVGVVGLGAGALACYARPDSEWTFFEIDPLVETLARDPGLFTFLEGCSGDHEVVIGDGRISLTRSTARFDVLVIDAFNSDAVPVHLLTREAVALYAEHLRPGGWLVFHISNHYLDLLPLMAALGEDAGMEFKWGGDERTLDDVRAYRLPSRWVVLSATGDARMDKLGARPNWRDSTGIDQVPVWTDDYSNIFTLLRS